MNENTYEYINMDYLISTRLFEGKAQNADNMILTWMWGGSIKVPKNPEVDFDSSFIIDGAILLQGKLDQKCRKQETIIPWI